MYETMPGHALRIFALISCEPSRERARERGEAGEAGEAGGQAGREGGSDAPVSSSRTYRRRRSYSDPDEVVRALVTLAVSPTFMIPNLGTVHSFGFVVPATPRRDQPLQTSNKQYRLGSSVDTRKNALSRSLALKVPRDSKRTEGIHHVVRALGR